MTENAPKKPNVDAIVAEIRHIRDTDPAAAAGMLDGLLKVAPGNARANMMRGYLYQKEGKLAEAVACFDAAVKSDPSCPIANSSLGRCLFESGKPQEAEPFLRHALQLEPVNYLVTKNLGFCLAKSGQYGEALKHLRVAHADDPENPKILNGIGYALCALGDETKAKRKILPLIRSAEKTGIPDATGHIAALLRLKDEYADASDNGMSYYREAASFLVRAVEKAPNNPTHRLNLGWCYAGMGEYGKAETELKKSAELDAAPLTLYYLAQVYTAQAQAMMDLGELDWAGGRDGARQVIAKAVGACANASHRTPSPTLDKPNDFSVAVSRLQYGRLHDMNAEITRRLEASKAALMTPAAA